MMTTRKAQQLVNVFVQGMFTIASSDFKNVSQISVHPFIKKCKHCAHDLL